MNIRTSITSSAMERYLVDTPLEELRGYVTALSAEEKTARTTVLSLLDFTIWEGGTVRLDGRKGFWFVVPETAPFMILSNFAREKINNIDDAAHLPPDKLMFLFVSVSTGKIVADCIANVRFPKNVVLWRKAVTDVPELSKYLSVFTADHFTKEAARWDPKKTKIAKIGGKEIHFSSLAHSKKLVSSMLCESIINSKFIFDPQIISILYDKNDDFSWKFPEERYLLIEKLYEPTRRTEPDLQTALRFLDWGRETLENTVFSITALYSTVLRNDSVVMARAISGLHEGTTITLPGVLPLAYLRRTTPACAEILKKRNLRGIGATILRYYGIHPRELDAQTLDSCILSRTQGLL